MVHRWWWETFGPNVRTDAGRDTSLFINISHNISKLGRLQFRFEHHHFPAKSNIRCLVHPRLLISRMFLRTVHQKHHSAKIRRVYFFFIGDFFSRLFFNLDFEFAFFEGKNQILVFSVSPLIFVYCTGDPGRAGHEVQRVLRLPRHQRCQCRIE